MWAVRFLELASPLASLASYSTTLGFIQPRLLLHLKAYGGGILRSLAVHEGDNRQAKLAEEYFCDRASFIGNN